MCRMSVPDQRARTHVHALHDPDATVVQTLFRPPNLFGGTENHILRPHSITSGSDCTRARYLPPFSTARCTRTVASADPRQGPILWRMWCDVCGREWGKRPEHAGFGDPDEIRVDHEVKPENPTRPAPEIPEPPKKEHHNRGQRMRGRTLFRARGATRAVRFARAPRFRAVRLGLSQWATFRTCEAAEVDSIQKRSSRLTTRAAQGSVRGRDRRGRPASCRLG